MVNLDIGRFARGGNDPFAYLQAHHDRITHVHIRDQKKDGSPANVGEGDLQVPEILTRIRDNNWPIACILEQGRIGFDSTMAARITAPTHRTTNAGRLGACVVGIRTASWVG